tara:strand:+ start:385 stop:1104 length:720 start_codon:yes stop_codon:yes gene_type:complete
MKKLIIIDFDNTIGYFSQVVYLINIIEKTYSRKMTQDDINTLLRIYSNSFRPKIFEILKFIYELKVKNIIHALILYTRNKNERFVKMVLVFIEEYILQQAYNEKEMYMFDDIVFSETKTKQLEPLLKMKNMSYNDEDLRLCFIDNMNYNYEEQSISNITVFFIECDNYKFYYTPEEIARNMDYEIYSKLNKKIVYKYLKNIYKNKKVMRNIPFKIHTLNSLYIFNLLNNFCFLKSENIL